MTLDDLRGIVERWPAGSPITLPREALLEALGSVQTSGAAAEDPERWLTVEECAQLLNVSERYCYDHGKELGKKRYSPRCVRFSARAIERYLARRG